ncbi:hypothetical protein OAN74_01155 [Gammaproteobacteria bacterium]|nr:hypothetical protein [Gammaproteobacteria bacterium]
MKPTFNKDWSINFTYLPLIVFALLSTVLIFYQGAIFVPDSNSYILTDLAAGDIVRPALYPFILDIVELLIGSESINVMVWLQFSLGLLAIYLVAEWCQTIFEIPALQMIGLYFILYLPYLIPGLWLGNTIASEALAYPLFLIFIKYFFTAFHNRLNINYYYLAISLLVFTLIILTRKQFYFMAPFMMIMPILFSKFKSLRSSVVLICLTLGCLILSFSVERVSNSYRFGEPTGSPDIGMQFVVAQLYLSNETQINLMQTEDERTFFAEAQDKMKTQALSLQHLGESQRKSLGLFGAYFFNYNPILHTALDISQEKYSNIQSHYERNVKSDQLMMSVALKLFPNNIYGFMKLYIFNAIHGLGGNFSVGFSMPLLFLLFFIYHSWKVVSTKDDNNVSIIILGLLLLHLANIFTVALVEPTMIRYMFYTWTGPILAFFLSSTCEVKKICEESQT